MKNYLTSLALAGLVTFSSLAAGEVKKGIYLNDSPTRPVLGCVDNMPYWDCYVVNYTVNTESNRTVLEGYSDLNGWKDSKTYKGTKKMLEMIDEGKDGTVDRVFEVQVADEYERNKDGSMKLDEYHNPIITAYKEKEIKLERKDMTEDQKRHYDDKLSGHLRNVNR